MIKYNLKCHKNHEFESWFSDSSEFDKLKKKKLLECIFCLSKKIDKSIMAPMVSSVKKNNNNKIKTFDKNLLNEKSKLLQLRKFVENNFEYVGKNFSKKVREVYYDDENKKAIYGVATPKEKEELEDEGIDLFTIPWVSKDN
jgi:hypothetical protein|tara:strand:- start:684 stop:1109 length:426 start_codon:yes stop_codon:yes gene_type:complete